MSSPWLGKLRHRRIATVGSLATLIPAMVSRSAPEHRPRPRLTRRRLVTALLVAAAADVVDVAITAGENATLGLALVPGEFAAGVLDVVVMAVMCRLLGFHWLFLPTFALEVVPEVDALPTWLGCVGVVAWQRRREDRKMASTESPAPPPLPGEPGKLLLPAAGDAPQKGADRG